LVSNKNINTKKKITKSEIKFHYSDELEKKLALLISDIDIIDEKDLKRIEYKEITKQIAKSPLICYRLDFHTRNELNLFKKKYKSLVL